MHNFVPLADYEYALFAKYSIYSPVVRNRAIFYMICSMSVWILCEIMLHLEFSLQNDCYSLLN